MSLENIEELFVKGEEFFAQKKYDQAIELMLKIKPDDGKENYALAQFNLGTLYEQQDRFDDAEQAYNNVVKEDSAVQYARAQFNLANGYRKQGDNKTAIQFYKKVLREDSKEYFAKAQLNLGLLYKQQNKFDDAEKVYKNVLKEDSAARARAQANLGVLYQQQDKFDDAEQAYKNVLKEDSAAQYARTQFNLGLLYEQQDKLDDAEQAYNNVLKEDAPANLYYAYAQWNLYILFQNIDYLQNIEKDDDLETYAESQFILGEQKDTLKEKIAYWVQVPYESKFYEQKKYSIRLAQEILALNNPVNEDALDQTLGKVDGILSLLFVDLNNEQSIAHYTNLTVSKLLLSQKKSEDKKTLAVSQLRLNTINLMNDPEEGRVLYKFLSHENKIDTLDLAFIACFTLHHDSLNQFRLYGKQNQQEASGLSLVLSKDFFAASHNAASIHVKTQPLHGVVDDDDNRQEKLLPAEQKLPAMPLYRCIYLDPTSNYIKVAQREEWSFCREDKKPSSRRWKAYLKEINQIESEIRVNLNELSDLIKDLNLEELNAKAQELLAEILLPLRYLIKHMAFKEEQECRMVYVTQMDNDLIQYDEKINRVYIDYAPSLMQYLEKIYLAPKAADEKTVFEYLCAQGKKHGVNGKGVKVKISQNPFR